MENQNKGGRPTVKYKKTEQLSTQTNLLDRKIIESKAKKANMTVSEFLRLQALNGEVKVKSIPKEVLQIMGTLNHNSANLNQIAHQLNSKNLLSPVEHLRLNGLIKENQNIVELFREEFKNDR